MEGGISNLKPQYHENHTRKFQESFSSLVYSKCTRADATCIAKMVLVVSLHLVAFNLVKIENHLTLEETRSQGLMAHLIYQL